MIRATLLLIASAAFACAAGPEAIQQTEREYGKALAAGDTAALDKLISADLLYTHSGSNTDTKDTYLGALKSGNLKYTLFDYEKMDSKMYGNTGLIFAVVHVKSLTKGTESESRLRIIHVWVKQGGRWQLVAHQSTKLPS
jgi:ketosteroid isomerase-like protein